MFSLIERFMNNLTKETLNGYAKNANINFSEEELDFAYRFTKKIGNQYLPIMEFLILKNMQINLHQKTIK
jgi:hypothetical protein